MYIHERADWPNHWNSEALTSLLAEVRHRQGRLLGQMQTLGFGLQGRGGAADSDRRCRQPSAIEGQDLDPATVRSSIARRLGMDVGGLTPVDRDVEGVVEMMLDATRNYDKPLHSEESGYSAGMPACSRLGAQRDAALTVGAWRNDSDGPMQVVSTGRRAEKVD